MDQWEMLKNRRVVPADKKAKLFADAMKPIVVSSLSDIKMVIGHLLGGKEQSPPIKLATELTWTEEGKNQKQQVSVSSESTSLYDLIITGFDVIKKRIEAFQKVKAAVEKARKQDEDIPNMDVWSTDKAKFNVDYLIQRRLGAKRNGLRIRWEVSEGIFEYDIYENKLYQMEEADAKHS
jgi:hypothetical protein